MFSVGEPGLLTCSSDLDVTSVEWLYNGRVVAHTALPELQLMFAPVNDSVHGREYTCQVTSPYGIQQNSVSISTLSKCHGMVAWLQDMYSTLLLVSILSLSSTAIAKCIHCNRRSACYWSEVYSYLHGNNTDGCC